MTDRFTIGQLAKRTGVSVRTIRFWSDLGLLSSTRSSGSYRLYDAEAAARLDLIRTLRELGVDVPTVRRVLERQVSLSDVVRAHIAALDMSIEALRLRRAVLRSVAERNSTTEELRLMHKLAQLSAAERQQLIDDFVTETFDGLPDSHIARGMRQLPDNPAPEQVDAWIELAELVSDKDFRARVRQMAVTGASGTSTESKPPTEFDATFAQQVQTLAGEALKDGVDPASPEGQAILARILGQSDRDRRELADELETFTDRRVERFWQLLGILNNRPPFEPAVPAYEWLIAALRASPSPENR
ncbi:MerR family transcriptional regulator [Allorhizocola rhizosphaerae]|uniref:MerR family transcriptional regulator n=1 Tax=Allorhizocola rhizosphaerae TaxID=1872709 RepID=UPI000E3E0B6B|nr:MerR family transcriptional regulator [Allorhizocola rhizosphaerae]